MKNFLNKIPNLLLPFLAVVVIVAFSNIGIAFADRTPVSQFQSLTTTGSSGAASLSNGVLNIPVYSGGGSGAAYPFPVTGNATSTLTQFNGGLTAYASSTIGGTGAQGLTVNGNSTTTGIAYFAGNTGFGTSSPADLIDLYGTQALNTNAGGIDFETQQSGLVGQILSDPILLSASGGQGQLVFNFPGVTSGNAGAGNAINWLAYRFNGANNKWFFGDNGSNAFFQTAHPEYFTALSSTLPSTSALPTLTIDTTVRVGVSTSSPFAKFSVQALNGDTNTTLFVVGSSTANSTTTLFEVSNTGAVGIGTTTPTSMLTLAPTPIQLVSTVPLFQLGTSTLVSPSSNGTYFGVNAPIGFGGNFLHFQKAGSDVFQIQSSGKLVEKGDASFEVGNTFIDTLLSTSNNQGTIGNSGDFFNRIFVTFASSTSYTSTGTSTFNVLGVGTTTPMATLAVSAPTGVLADVISVVISGVTYMASEIDAVGHIVTGGPTPTVGTCASVTGDDKNMRVITGTSQTTCTINFATAYTNTPVCVATEESGGTTAVDASSTPTGIVFGFGGSLTAKSVSVHCEVSRNFTF